MTRVQSAANVPFVRFKEYLEDLRRKGLLTDEPGLTITDEGRRYMEEYRRVRAFLERFGLTHRESVHDSLPLRGPVPDTPADPRSRKRSEEAASSQGDKS